MKILFVWTGLTRCAGDCWRALAACEGVELKVVLDAEPDAAVEREILHDLDYTLDPTSVPAAYRPDVLFVVGWHSKVVRRFVARADWADVPKVCCFDMPWRFKLRCFAARFVLARYVRCFAAAYVPGALGEKYARYLGFRRVARGFLSADLARFADAPQAVRREGFLFVGRRSPEKRLDLVEAAHRRYRQAGGAWPLVCHHTTPYGDLPAVYAAAGCLVLASERDAWPLVALEAKAAGCDVILSDRCGNRVDLPNVHVVRFGDIAALAEKMREVERTSRARAAACADDLSFWDCRAWAARTVKLAEEIR